MALRDYIPGGGIRPEIPNTRGHILDDETANKKAARRSAGRKGRLNLFEAHPKTKRLFPIKRLLQANERLRPEYGRPWYKTYRIKEEASHHRRIVLSE
jgi:hypothetical protein